MNYKVSVNNRIEFAREQYVKILVSFQVTKTGQLLDLISGYKARKLNQAYKIYAHYLTISELAPRGTAGFYNR